MNHIPNLVFGLEYRIQLLHKAPVDRIKQHIHTHYYNLLAYDATRNMLIVVNHIDSRERCKKQKIKFSYSYSSNIHASVEIPQQIQNICIPMYIDLPFYDNETKIIQELYNDELINKWRMHEGMWYEVYNYSKYDPVYTSYSNIMNIIPIKISDYRYTTATLYYERSPCSWFKRWINSFIMFYTWDPEQTY